LINKKKLLSALVCAFLVFPILGVTVCGKAEAQVTYFTTIFINPDGSVTGTSSIQQNGDIYTLTGNISGGISIQKSYVTLDGAGFTINGNGQYIGVDLGNGVGQDPSRPLISNVTVTNLKIINCTNAVGNENTYNNTFIGNYISGCDTGFWITGSANNTLIHNTVENCTTGISINYCSGSSAVIENNILSSWSVWLSPDPTVDRNYWGDYTTLFPNATEIDDTGVWDTPYSRGDKIIDYHPLTTPITISSTPAPTATPSQPPTSSPISTASETPAIPEFPTTPIVVLLVATLVALIAFRRIENKQIT
jgi:parallel beta-helix repeat protein